VPHQERIELFDTLEILALVRLVLEALWTCAIKEKKRKKKRREERNEAEAYHNIIGDLED